MILPHGVLFRGNLEAQIRTQILGRGFIKGIIGLPANLFYGSTDTVTLAIKWNEPQRHKGHKD